MRKSMSTFALPALLATAALFAAQPARADYVQPHIEHADFGTVRIVVPVTSPDPEVWGFKLHNLMNSIKGVTAWHGKLQAEVVVYGPGVNMLVEPVEPALQATIDKLRAQGVKFAVCNNTLKAKKLDWHQLYKVKEQDIVPSGFLEVGWLGNHGWSVDPMN